MNKVILSIACTVDGHIARKNGSVDFLDPFNEDAETANFMTEFLKSISVIVMGNTTFQEYNKHPKFFDYYKGKDIFVYSRNTELKHEKVTFTDEDPKEFLENLKTEGNVWLVGGAIIINSFQEQGLIDEYILTIIPVMIGSGIPLFLHSKNNTDVKLVKTESFKSGIVNIYYSKK